MHVGAAGVECAMFPSQCSFLSTGHSAREFLWAEWESIALCPHICPLKNDSHLPMSKKKEKSQAGCLNIVKVSCVMLAWSETHLELNVGLTSPEQIMETRGTLTILLYLMSALFLMWCFKRCFLWTIRALHVSTPTADYSVSLVQRFTFDIYYLWCWEVLVSDVYKLKVDTSHFSLHHYTFFCLTSSKWSSEEIKEFIRNITAITVASAIVHTRWHVKDFEGGNRSEFRYVK